MCYRFSSYHTWLQQKKEEYRVQNIVLQLQIKCRFIKWKCCIEEDHEYIFSIWDPFHGGASQVLEAARVYVSLINISFGLLLVILILNKNYRWKEDYFSPKHAIICEISIRSYFSLSFPRKSALSLTLRSPVCRFPVSILRLFPMWNKHFF